MKNKSFDADVIVVGMGVMGSQALWSLARRGLRVIGIEQFDIGHDRGASHGESKIIRTAYWEGADYVPLVQRAWELWRHLEMSTRAEIVDSTGALSIGSGDSPAITGAIASAEAHALKFELLGSAAIGERFPQHRVSSGTVGFLEVDAGLVRAEMAVRATVHAALDAGATVMERQRITALTPDPVGPRVLLGDRELCASHIVVTAGAWLPSLLTPSPVPLQVTRRVMGWFAVDNPSWFRPEQFPVFIRSDANGDRNWYGFPTLDGDSIKISVHRWPGIDEPVDPQVGPRSPDSHDAATLEHIVAHSLNKVNPRAIRLQACTYTVTPDQHFVVGNSDDLPGLTILGGFSGHGFKFAPVMGEIAADLAIKGRTDHPIDLFDPLRFRREG